MIIDYNIQKKLTPRIISVDELLEDCTLTLA